MTAVLIDAGVNSSESQAPARFRVAGACVVILNRKRCLSLLSLTSQDIAARSPAQQQFRLRYVRERSRPQTASRPPGCVPESDAARWATPPAPDRPDAESRPNQRRACRQDTAGPGQSARRNNCRCRAVRSAGRCARPSGQLQKSGQLRQFVAHGPPFQQVGVQGMIVRRHPLCLDPRFQAFE